MNLFVLGQISSLVIPWHHNSHTHPCQQNQQIGSRSNLIYLFPVNLTSSWNKWLGQLTQSMSIQKNFVAKFLLIFSCFPWSKQTKITCTGSCNINLIYVCWFLIESDHSAFYELNASCWCNGQLSVKICDGDFYFFCRLSKVKNVWQTRRRGTSERNSDRSAHVLDTCNRRQVI